MIVAIVSVTPGSVYVLVENFVGVEIRCLRRLAPRVCVCVIQAIPPVADNRPLARVPTNSGSHASLTELTDGPPAAEGRPSTAAGGGGSAAAAVYVNSAFSEDDDDRRRVLHGSSSCDPIQPNPSTD